jgi:Dullard-like phosphatase family protein
MKGHESKNLLLNLLEISIKNIKRQKTDNIAIKSQLESNLSIMINKGRNIIKPTNLGNIISSINPSKISNNTNETLLSKKSPTKLNSVKRTAMSLSPKKNHENQSYLIPAPNKKRNGEFKTLVLDLDETLVHSSFDYIEDPDLIIPIVIDEIEYEIYVLIRPGCQEFLTELSHFFELVIFTASLSKYADPLISQLDPHKVTDHRLFREHCTYIDGGYVKDLSKLGRNMRNIIIVDNAPVSYSLQTSNGIPIKSWFDDKRDKELYRLLPILKNLSGFYDVRTEIPKFVINNTFIWNKANNWAEENYILNSIMNEKEDESIGKLSIQNMNILCIEDEDIGNNNNNLNENHKEGNLKLIF